MLHAARIPAAEADRPWGEPYQRASRSSEVQARKMQRLLGEAVWDADKVRDDQRLADPDRGFRLPGC